MTTSSHVRARLVPVSLLAAVAMSAGVLGFTAPSDHAASAMTHPATHRVLTSKQAAFHDQMRKLWEDHVTWTRLAIVTFAGDQAAFPATGQRLLRNQQDIGDAIKPFYGVEAGDRLTALLHDHITIAVELLQAAKSGDQARVADAADRWYANADDIADFLAAANPRYWPQVTMRQMMTTHLDQTLAEAQHELAGDYAAGVDDYEVIHAHILDMADVLSSGIIRTFPQHFR
jgi:hypothetical protein